jgi:hypothetical protein
MDFIFLSDVHEKHLSEWHYRVIMLMSKWRCKISVHAGEENSFINAKPTWISHHTVPQISVSVNTFLRKFVCFLKSREKSVKKLGKIIIILDDASGLTLNTLTNVNAKWKKFFKVWNICHKTKIKTTGQGN